MQSHCEQVHKRPVDSVPNTIAGRESFDLDVHGMTGIPTRDLAIHRQQRFGVQAS